MQTNESQKRQQYTGWMSLAKEKKIIYQYTFFVVVLIVAHS